MCFAGSAIWPMVKAEGLESAEQLQSYMIRRMERFANGHGKRIIGWDEIL